MHVLADRQMEIRFGVGIQNGAAAWMINVTVRVLTLADGTTFDICGNRYYRSDSKSVCA